MTQRHYPYLIVGGGMAADAAVRGIRESDSDGPIGLIGAEPDPPYKRPPLSKKLWQGKALESIWLKTERRGVEMHLGRTALVLDPRQKQVVDDRGDVYGFDSLLLATGVTPNRLPFGGHRVTYFRTLHDYQRLRQEASDGRRFAVIGGGFIGSEIAASLTMNGNDVDLIFPEAGIGGRLFPPDLSYFLNDLYREHGVQVRAGSTISDIEERGGRLVLRLEGGEPTAGREIEVDGVVAGLGARPNVDLALAAGLTVDDGIVVDEFLRTSHPDVYAAGDVASYWQAALGKRRRVEHEDNARMMGRVAGRAMAGQREVYDHLPFFYSDLFDLGYEAVGEVNSRLQMNADWEEPFRAGTVTYLQDGRVRGALLWKVWGQLDAARALIADADAIPAGRAQGELATAR